jgi:hypothetical protein
MGRKERTFERTRSGKSKRRDEEGRKGEEIKELNFFIIADFTTESV